MRFLYFTDSHIRGTSPKSRIDDFFLAVQKKLIEIVELSKTYEVDYILHGGDLFDRPDVSISVINEIAPILQQFEVPLYSISGNHDIYGHNPKTLHRTTLGLLNALGIVIDLNYKSILLEKEDTCVQLSGSPYIYGIDREEHRHLYIVDKVDPKATFSIHLVHGFLMDKKFLAQVPHTLISEIKETKADLTICGHYHFGFKEQEIDGKKFINPGSIVRISNSTVEINRKPKVLLIDVNGNQCEMKEIFLKSAKNGNEILDRTEIETHRFKRQEMLSFKETIERTTNLNKVNFIDLITEIATNYEIDKEVREEALDRIARIQEEGKN
ncbi:metallophosphoesterase family protein [Peptoniphilus sp. KCTC 25270]|uniref:metallophosphoesterase family protein n=1 Tax=Peptoniphilus sp. KCTC 25270 TaxID=2897414 RepID=UPI001E525CFE|nr:metallophosphoesterase family protein [Peptoniphilus sp. KCTC 25270]MCD1147002.1 metallophosphoesterase family protein [Peptoniphilus sp. KCTC 25270]